MALRMALSLFYSPAPKKLVAPQPILKPRHGSQGRKLGSAMGRIHCPFTLAQESLRLTVRLKTGEPGRDNLGSTEK